MYFDRNATQNAAKRSGSAGMDRRSNAAWVLPQAARCEAPTFNAQCVDSLPQLWL